MIKAIRTQEVSNNHPTANKVGLWMANNFSLINNTVPTFLNVVNVAHKVCRPLQDGFNTLLCQLLVGQFQTHSLTVSR